MKHAPCWISGRLVRRAVVVVTAWLASGHLPGAVQIPPGGEEISDPASTHAYVAAGFGSAANVAGQDGPVWRLQVRRADSSQPYQAQCAVACPRAGLQKGDRVLVVVKARVVDVEQGSLEAKLQLASAPYTAACGSTALDLTKSWAEYPVLFVVDTPLPPGKAGVTLFAAQAVQTVEIAAVRAWRYGPGGDDARFPRLRRTYAGREADAPWRREALARIERERKTDCELTVVDATGKPLAGRQVRLVLRRHEFGFGSAVPASWLVATSEDGRRFRGIVDRLFSIVVFENDLKDMFWGDNIPTHEKSARRAELDKAFAWLGERHIAVRGHYLMQVAVPGNLEKLDNDAVRRHFLETTRARVSFVGDRVCEWDAINHPVAWGGAKLFVRRPGLETLDREVLALARSLTPLPQFVNEDQLFRPGPQSDGTFDYLQALRKDGVVIDGLGNQAHFHESYLPSPEHVLKTTDRFARLVPRQSITEYDVQTVLDEELAADFTRDLLIACFSHPAYSSFLWWGFWEGSHWRPDAASWNKDWSIRKRGEVIEEWIGKRWRTEVTLTTGRDGRVTWRGFPGWYDAGGAEGPGTVGSFQVTRDRPAARLTWKRTD